MGSWADSQAVVRQMRVTTSSQGHLEQFEQAHFSTEQPRDNFLTHHGHLHVLSTWCGTPRVCVAVRDGLMPSPQEFHACIHWPKGAPDITNLWFPAGHQNPISLECQPSLMHLYHFRFITQMEESPWKRQRSIPNIRKTWGKSPEGATKLIRAPLLWRMRELRLFILGKRRLWVDLKALSSA